MGKSVLTQKRSLMNAMKLSSKDIILRDRDDSYYFLYLEWDSNFFKRPCYMFAVENSKITKSNDCSLLKISIFGNFANRAI